MQKILLSFILMGYSSFAIALLPPLYQSSKEVATILNDTKVQEKISSGRGIKTINKTDTGYLITTTGECTLPVNIKYVPLPNGMVGPAAFEIEVGELNCPKTRITND